MTQRSDRRGASEPSAGVLARVPSALFGRDAELTQLHDLIDSADQAGGALLIVGDPGIGKTALLDDAVAYAVARGWRLAPAAGSEFEVDITFAALNQLLTPFLDELPSLGLAHREALTSAVALDGGPATEPARVAVATLALLRRVANMGPLLLVVDDVGWLDRASARVLGFVTRRLAGTGIAVLASARAGEAGYLDQAAFARLEVAPLNLGAAEALLLDRFPALTSRVRHRLLADAAGNPLALLELPVALESAQRAKGHALPTILPLTQRLHDVFAARIRAQPASTRELLLLAALDGTGELSILVNDAPNGVETLDALGPAERTRLLSVDPETRLLKFRHPLTRAAVVDLATDAERRQAHAVLAARRGGDLERRAWHLAAAALGPDDVVAAALEEAAHRALDRGDPVGAVAALVRAADLSVDTPHRRRRLGRAAYLGAEVTGDLGIAPRLLDEAALAGVDRETALVTTLAAAAQLLNGDGDLDTAHLLLANSIEMLAGDYDAHDQTLLEALHTLVLICLFGGRPELWEPFDRAFARLTPGPPALLSLMNRTVRDPARTAHSALDDLDIAVAQLPRERDPARIVRVAIAGAYLDRLAACREALKRVAADGRTGGAIAAAIDALFLLGNAAYFTGRWDELEAVTAEGLRLCEDHEYRLLAWPGYFLRGLVAAARGDVSASGEVQELMSGWASPRRIRLLQLYTAHIACLEALGRQDFDAAYRHAARISPAGELASCVPHALWLIWDLTEAAVRSRRHAEAAAHVRAAESADVASLSPRLVMLVKGAAALTAPAAEASERFEAALSVPDPERWPFDLARIRLAYGEHLRRTRNPAAARAQLVPAVETFRQLAAAPWLDRALRELRATGRTSGQPGGADVVLTPQQRQIAELAATGLTNKEIGARLFLSPRTVATHLYGLFPKLGVTSRAALRDALDLLPADWDAPDPVI